MKTIRKRNGKPRVSEHALCRYLHRVEGLDLRDIADEILDDHTYTIVDQLGNCTIKKDGYQVIARNKIIVTVLPTTSHTKAKKGGTQRFKGNRNHKYRRQHVLLHKDRIDWSISAFDNPEEENEQRR